MKAAKRPKRDASIPNKLLVPESLPWVMAALNSCSPSLKVSSAEVPYCNQASQNGIISSNKW